MFSATLLLLLLPVGWIDLGRSFPAEREASNAPPANPPADLEPSPRVETVEDRNLGFRLVLPPGFIPMPLLAEKHPAISHPFAIAPTPDSAAAIVFGIEEMKGPVSQVRLRSEPPGLPANVKVSSAYWRGYEVNTFEMEETAGDAEFITFKAQIPLRQKAILVLVGGPERCREEIRGYFTQILGSLEGETNWSRKGMLGEEQNWQPLMSREMFLVAFPIIAVVLVMVMWIVVRNSQRWFGFVLSIILWIVGNGLAHDRAEFRDMARSVLLFGEILKLAGAIGFAISIIEFFIPRAETPPPQDMHYPPYPRPPYPHPAQPIEAEVLPDPLSRQPPQQ